MVPIQELLGRLPPEDEDEGADVAGEVADDVEMEGVAVDGEAMEAEGGHGGPTST